MEFNIPYHRLIRYPLLVFITTIKILRHSPPVIFAQNPSIVLATLCVILGRLLKIKVVVDAHNAGVYPFEGEKKWANHLAEYLFKTATITIVTNEALKEYVESKGGKAYVLPDPFPDIKDSQSVKVDLEKGYNALFICTWAQDEPYLELIKAASLLDDSYTIYITGNSKGRELAYPDVLPENIRLTGFVEENTFIAYLCRSDVIIDLTTREDCLVCGAYEAVSAAKPLILSNTEALKAYFQCGVVYVDNSADGIAAAIIESREKHAQLNEDIVTLKNIKQDQWEKLRVGLLDQINELYR